MMRTQFKTDWLKIFSFCFVIRSLLYLWGAYSFDFAKFPHENWWSIWHRWDILHFENIARFLYYPGRVTEDEHQFLSQIPPGYPLAIRFFLRLGFPLIFSEYFISLGSFLLASLLLYELCRHEFENPKIALRAVLLLYIFPTSYFCQAPYSESLFLFWTILAFYLLRVREYYFEACFSAFLAIITRWIGVTLIPMLLWEGYRLYRQKKISLAWWICSLSVAAGGVGVFLGINRYFYSSFFAFREHAKKNVSIVRIDSLPYTSLVHDVGTFLQDPWQRLGDTFFMFTAGWGGLFLVLATICLPLIYRRLALPYFIFSTTYVLFLSCLSWALSTNRYLFALFPVSMAFATVESRLARTSAVVFYISFLLYFTQVFVRGTWAF